ncbi:MFS transporter [Leeia sp. TBRC 13508]|uniref:MFS transporter n=1 Tax=Leeia speluncae TaxID=2884804 RepID=A0ABS8D8C7_9NEIS|nr:MFS transporter [Leeia speluncae]MCB6184196.1 MFS transporter [Leeia speluncae]
MSSLYLMDAHQHSAPPENGDKWRLRFWSIFIGQGLSLCGSALTQFVLLWWITDTTGNVSDLAIAGVAAMLPQALLSPLGGVFSDRYSRRVLMILADVISALCMVVLIILFLTAHIALWHAWVMMAIRSAMQAFQMPAAAASIYMLVPRQFLPRATGFEHALQSLTVVTAAPLGAMAIGAMPIGWALAIDVCTAICGVLPLLCFRIPQIFTPNQSRPGILVEFKEGLSAVRNTPGLVALFILLATTVLVIMPAFTLLPMLVKQHFSGSPTQVAWMEGLSGIGMVIGGVAVGAMVPQRPILWILVGFACSCFSIALTALVPGNLFGVAVAWWVMSGVFFIFGDVPLTTMLQTLVPNQLQGRVFSILNAIMSLSAPVGLLVITPLSETLGVRWIFILSGCLGGFISIIGFLFPSLQRLGQSNGKHSGID